MKPMTVAINLSMVQKMIQDTCKMAEHDDFATTLWSDVEDALCIAQLHFYELARKEIIESMEVEE